MPVAHSLLQAQEEIEQVLEDVSEEELRYRPGEAASIGFHIFHIAGSMDRLFTYARGEALGDDQKEWLQVEREFDNHTFQVEDLSKATRDTTAKCLTHLQGIDHATIFAVRHVGQARLPSSVAGLLFHAAEHTTRHVGQIRTTLKIIRALNS